MSPTPMKDGFARTHIASGRFRSLAGLLAVALSMSGCQTVGGPHVGAGADEPVGPPPVIVASGTLSGGEREEANRLWLSAQRSFEARRFLEAIRTSLDLVDRFPASEVSGKALRLTARAYAEAGDSVSADRSAASYAELLPPRDPRGGEMRLLQASVLSEDSARVDRLLRIDEGTSLGEIIEATSQLRAAADSLEVDVLRVVIDGVLPLRGPLMSVAEARLAVSLLELGRVDDAMRLAQNAIDAGASGEDRAWAEGVLIGELPEGRGRETAFTIGAVLPLGGPPALAEFSTLIAEGIDVAARTVLGAEFEVTVDLRDDEGDPTLTLQRMAELDSVGVVGVVGFLQDDDLLAAAAARARGITLVSPTARSADRAGEAVYSLEGADPQAAASIARYAASRAFQRVAIVHPQTPEAESEARAFEVAAARLGMPVVGRFAYEAGATFFEPQIAGALAALRNDELDRLDLAPNDTLHMEVLEPTALFMPIPPEDVEFLAPQVIHFGLDTLAVEILGTSGWTDPQILAAVESRLTTGVVATAPVASPEALEGRARFQRRYETMYQRSLVGGTASVGYDATLLLLEALRRGRIAPQDVQASFEALAGVAGATGMFSVVEGRVVRNTEVVRIEDQMAVPIQGTGPALEEGR
jgi:ABC-type branched-subunit amino acid transport system substrate-binding protein